MSQQMEAQTGQAGSKDAPAASAETSTPPRPTRWGERLAPEAAVQESIKYRRRAQEAEKRAEALEAEIQELREGRAERIMTLESELSAARAESEAMRGRLETIERDRRLEREFIRAGCADLETALALAHERLVAQVGAGGSEEHPAAVEDPAAFVRSLLDEKPHLRATVGAGTSAAHGAGGLPPKTAGAQAAAAGTPRRAVERLAERARTGSPGDLMAYMRARRGHA
jgi:hypothetical protein